jgi:glycosyltransferase involved in cell wall biosynthesis
MIMQNARPQVLFLNRSYWPDVEATGQLLTELCESLSSTFDVHVAAGQPNEVRDPHVDSAWRSTPVRHGVRIHRADHWRLPKRKMLLKGLNYLSFVRATRKILKTIDAPDVVVFETDPFLLPFEAARLQRRTGCRMVGYLQDIYPDVAVALGKVPNNWAIQRLRKSLFSIYRRCDRMVVLSEDMKQLLIDGGVQSDRIDLVPNWADPTAIFPVEESNHFRVRHGLQDHFVVMYSGNLGLTQRLDEFVEAAQLLADDQEICFAFVGQGSQKQALENLVRQKGLSNVRFFDYQPKSELAHSLSAADLHLVPLTKELSQCLMPSKLYGIMAAGRPYLTNAVPESELHQLTRQHNIGITVKPGSPAEIATAVLKAKQDPAALQAMGRIARELAINEFTRERSVEKFRRILEQVVGRESAGCRLQVADCTLQK